MTRAPNILLIFTDQLRADALGCYGNTIVRTPHLDALAEEGTLFEQCMITHPTCTPSRASILTGVYPSALRTTMVGCSTPDDPRFLPRVFGEEGYHTASIGKIHLISQGKEPAAIEDTKDTISGMYDYHGFHEVDVVNGHGDGCFGTYYTPWLLEKAPDATSRTANRELYPHGVQSKGNHTAKFPLPAETHSSAYIGTKTVEFLERQSTTEKPFFLHVSFNDPHHPFTVPEPWASMYDPKDMPAPIPHRPAPAGLKIRLNPDDPVDPEALYQGVHFGHASAAAVDLEGPSNHTDRITGTKPDDYSQYTLEDWQQIKATYYGMVSAIDHEVGRILKALKNVGIADNTIVVFVTDHGEYLGDHGLVGKGFHYDSVIRSPLIYKGPEVARGKRVPGIASTLDIAPTLLELSGIEEPEGVQGISMASVVHGPGTNPRTAALTENDDDFVPAKIRSLTTDEWKLNWYAFSDSCELYNRKSDPQENVNLWDNPVYADIQGRMVSMLLEELMTTFDTANRRPQVPRPVRRKWIARHNRDKT